MNLAISDLQPEAATIFREAGLEISGNPRKLAIEELCLFFHIGRDRNLHMMDAGNFHEKASSLLSCRSLQEKHDFIRYICIFFRQENIRITEQVGTAVLYLCPYLSYSVITLQER